MKKMILFSCLLAGFMANAQYSLRLVVTSAATKQGEDIYVSGNFNNWNPGEDKYKLKPFAGGRKSIVIKDLPAGTYAFKFTRGNFEKVECTADGRNIADRVVEVNGDASQECTVAGWKDDYPDKPKPYTASPQVKLMDTAFIIPQLNRTRRVWVYLPKGYASVGRAYPVLYMQDGQNLFNEQTAAFGEWGVDEALDSLQRITGKECIVVGIDHGGDKRLSEYSPYDFTSGKTTVTAEGKQYVDFIVNTLKPYIDSKYRTKKTAEFTSIAGSSMGGLISFYAITQHPEVFGAAGIFSPSFWVSPNSFTDGAKFTTKNTVRFYLYGGGKEGASMVTDLRKMEGLLKKNNDNYQVTSFVDPNGEHNEKNWRREFAGFYRWLVK
jgi:predicted alpha/beta superfamily hydrolase